MAIDCTAQGLAVASAKLTGSLSFKQLLAALVYIQCTSNGMTCDAESLSLASKCLYNCLTEKQLLAALVYIQCQGGGGGSVACGTGAPTAAPSGTCGFYIQTDSAPNPGVIWEYFGGAWHQG
jgi:hypothetical protein